MRNLLKTICLFFVLVLTTTLQAQSTKYAIVNTDTITQYGSTDTLDYLPILINTNGNVVVAGNQKMSSTQYDAMMAAETTSAVSLWITTFNTSNQKAFIAASSNDAYGNVYTAGGIRDSATGGLDYLVIKANAAGGVQWVAKYNGPGGQTDVASAIYVDDMSGDVFVTGVSDGGFPTFMDFATLRLNGTTGAQMWCKRYDYSNYFDIPTQISPSPGKVVVTGASGTSPIDYDIATVSYSEGGGTLVGESRNSNTITAGQDHAYGLVTDTLGNVYVSGSTYNGTSYDAFVQKLDTSLVPVWTKTLDLHGFDDLALGIDLDDSANVYVTGTSFSSATKKDLFLYKYTSTGDTAWCAYMQAAPGVESEGLRVKVKSYNEIFVGGNIINNGNQDVAVFRFNEYGRLTLAKSYDGPIGGKEQFMDMEIDANKIYVSARSYNGTLDDNIIIQYSYMDHAILPLRDSLTGVGHDKNQVLIKFAQNVMKMGAVNRKTFQFGVLSDFVKDSTCIKLSAFIFAQTNLDVNAGTFPTRKVFSEMTDADTISESRMGDYVKIPAFYTELLVSLPTFSNPAQVADTIGTGVKPDILRAQLNYLYDWNVAPNDPKYAVDQSSLHPTTQYPNAHINCEPAWDNYTKGNSFVRVGVYDSGFNMTHEDLVAGIVDAKSYVTGILSSQGVTDLFNHGTGVASIIGARTNNTLGIAGIAGGDASATGTANTGVSLINMKIGDEILMPTSTLKVAYVDGANSSNVTNGKALHITNHSYGNRNMVYDASLVEGINYLNLNGVAFIASRGNFGASTASSLLPTAANAPATLRPYKVMNVGASGDDGHWHKLNVNGGGFSSAYGREVDFVAPGNSANVHAAYAFDPGNPPGRGPRPNTIYGPFGGTSASAPHASGVTALMMSYRNKPVASWDNLIHEDCEALLRRTATDLSSSTYSEAVGTDSVTGAGRINAGAVMSALEPQYNIRHLDKTHSVTAVSTVTTVIAANQVFIWQGSSTQTLAYGWYVTDVIEVQTTYSYPYGSETFLAAWELYKASTGFPLLSGTLFIPTDEDAHVQLVSASNTSAVLKTYVYHCKMQSSNSATVNVYLPVAPNNINSAFTLYTINELVVGHPNENSIPDHFNIYPNPTDGQVTVEYVSEKETAAKLKITDMMGRLVYQQDHVAISRGANRYNLTLLGLPEGMYFVNLELINNERLVRKLVIN